MEDYIQFSAKTKNEAITKACLELGTSSDQLDIQVISEGSSGFFGIGSNPAVIKVRRIEPVSDMQEIDELVESVKLDAIKEEKKLEKPFTPDVKKESAPKAAPAEEKKPVKKEKFYMFRVRNRRDKLKFALKDWALQRKIFILFPKLMLKRLSNV